MACWIYNRKKAKLVAIKENNTTPFIWVLVIVKGKVPWKMEMSDELSYGLKTGEQCISTNRHVTQPCSVISREIVSVNTIITSRIRGYRI